MTAARLAVLGLLLVLVAASAASLAQPARTPCSTPEHRQFDFWVGDWEVRGPAGRLAGINRISSEYGGCVVHERYETDRGYRGESLNSYDPGRKVWRQTWVDNSGLVLLLEGNLRGRQMILEGETRSAEGKHTRHRITWTPNEDGSVRQLWETTDEKGDWITAFDGKYTRRDAPR